MTSWNSNSKDDPEALSAEVRDAIAGIGPEMWQDIEGHVSTINNTNIPLFMAFLIPLAGVVLAIYYFVRRAKWEDLIIRQPLPRIEQAFREAHPDDLKRMKRGSQQVRDLGRLFDARSTYKWLVIGNIAIAVFYLGSCLVGALIPLLLG